MLKLCVVLLATFVGLSTAFGPPGYFDEFSLLRCMVANPRAGQRDQPDTKEEPIPVLPFHVVYDNFGTWFQPVPSQIRSPVSGEFSAPLRDFLLEYVGSIVNIQLSTVGGNTPTSIDNAPAGQLIPQRLRLIEDGIGPIVEGLQNHTEEINQRLDDLGIVGPERQIIIDALLVLNDQCRVIAQWNRLPPGKFFPEWIFASYCPKSSNCTVPPGMACEPVVKKEAIAHTLFLQWDCCWSLINRRWSYECGWRKVRLAYIGRCDCACGVQYFNDQIIESGGIADPSVITYRIPV
jgi:hypothetical protein